MKATRNDHYDIINLIDPAGAVRKTCHAALRLAMTCSDERALLTHRLELGQIFIFFAFFLSLHTSLRLRRFRLMFPSSGLAVPGLDPPVGPCYVDVS